MSKPFADRIKIDSVNHKIFLDNKLDLTVWKTFKMSFIKKLWFNVKTNWLMLAFCVPVIVIIFLNQLWQLGIDITVPYSANTLTGYPYNENAQIIGNLRDFNQAMQTALWMLPCIIVACVGLAGVFNVAKYLSWGLDIKIVKTFFRGVKNGLIPFIWMGLILGLCYILMIFVINAAAVYSFALWQTILAIAGASLVCAFVAIIAMFYMTQASVFNLSILDIIKNSMLLGARFIVPNVILTALGIASFGLLFITFNSMVQIAAYMLFFMLAFSYTASVWTSYTHFVYGAIKKSDEPSAVKSQPTYTKGEKKKKTIKPVATYKNPKKMKKGNNKKSD